jgi:glycosyltransferase 2 family protein
LKNEQKNHLKLLIRVVLTLGLLTLLAFSIDLVEMGRILAGLRFDIFALLISLSLFERLLSTWKWRILLSIQGGRSLSLWELFRIQMTSGCFGLFLPSALGMDVLRMVAVSRCSANPAQAVAASAVDRGLSVLVNLLLAAVTALIVAGTYLPWPVAIFFPFFFLGFCGVGMVLMQPALNRWVAPLLRKVLGESITAKLRDFYAGLTVFRHQAWPMIQNSLIFGMMICVRIGMVYLQASALNIHVDPLLLSLVLPFVWVALMLPVSIGGLGLQEGAYFTFLGSIGVAGSAAVAISILEHVIVRVASLPGFYFYLRGGLVGGEIKPENSA